MASIRLSQTTRAHDEFKERARKFFPGDHEFSKMIRGISEAGLKSNADEKELMRHLRNLDTVSKKYGVLINSLTLRLAGLHEAVRGRGWGIVDVLGKLGYGRSNEYRDACQAVANVSPAVATLSATRNLINRIRIAYEYQQRTPKLEAIKLHWPGLLEKCIDAQLVSTPKQLVELIASKPAEPKIKLTEFKRVVSRMIIEMRRTNQQVRLEHAAELAKTTISVLGPSGTNFQAAARTHELKTGGASPASHPAIVLLLPSGKSPSVPTVLPETRLALQRIKSACSKLEDFGLSVITGDDDSITFVLNKEPDPKKTIAAMLPHIVELNRPHSEKYTHNQQSAAQPRATSCGATPRVQTARRATRHAIVQQQANTVATKLLRFS